MSRQGPVALLVISLRFLGLVGALCFAALVPLAEARADACDIASSGHPLASVDHQLHIGTSHGVVMKLTPDGVGISMRCGDDSEGFAVAAPSPNPPSSLYAAASATALRMFGVEVQSVETAAKECHDVALAAANGTAEIERDGLRYRCSAYWSMFGVSGSGQISGSNLPGDKGLSAVIVERRRVAP